MQIRTIDKKLFIFELISPIIGPILGLILYLPFAEYSYGSLDPLNGLIYGFFLTSIVIHLIGGFTKKPTIDNLSEVETFFYNYGYFILPILYTLYIPIMKDFIFLQHFINIPILFSLKIYSLIYIFYLNKIVKNYYKNTTKKDNYDNTGKNNVNKITNK